MKNGFIQKPKSHVVIHKRTRAHHVSSQVDTEDGDCSQGQRDVGDDEQQEGSDLWDVTGQSVGDGLLQVIKDQTT